MPLLTQLQDPGKWIEGVKEFAKLVGLDPSYLKYVWWAMLVVFLAWFLPWLVRLIWENWVKPLRLTPDEKRRVARRQMFAGVIEGRIRDINSNEDWRDYRFTELEAEVEAEGARQTSGLLPFRRRTQTGLRRERSLTRAIEMSRERLVQLEGEPGSGKSVALRFVARALAERATKSRSPKSVIPLYLNLKELSRAPHDPVDLTLIRSFVLTSLNKANDRDVEQFLEEEFTRGLQEGTWLFLFDSFDEIPEVLSSTEADEVIRAYAGAISDFLGGMNRCRGVCASRHFRGPGQSRWPRFRILPLSEGRRLKLIRQALLPPEVERQLTGHLQMAGPEMRDMAGNPMLLGLLCEYMKGGLPFPDNIHTILAAYLEHRLVRDEERVARRYGVGVPGVRAAAESAAFCMAADAGLGLSPARESLKQAITLHGFRFAGDLDTLLDALVFIKLARGDESASGGERLFSFAHRRFQEYFATRVVLREPGSASAQALLSDARWRETAVVMCQSQPAESLGAVAAEARRRLAEAVRELGLQPEPAPAGRAAGDGPEDAPLPERFSWPRGSLQLLSLLQDGLSRRREGFEEVRALAGRILLAVSRRGIRFDQKCALEVAGAADTAVTLQLLRDAFTSNSPMLKAIAYRQVARLGDIPDDIADAIRGALITLVRNGRLRAERLATLAHLAQLDKPERFISSLRLLLAIPHVDLLLHGLVFVELLALVSLSPNPVRGVGKVGEYFFIPLLISHLSVRMIRPLQALVGKGFDVMLIFYARLVVAVFVLATHYYVFTHGLNNPPLWRLTALFCVYVMLWLPSALVAARVGQCTGVGWWFVMPLVPPLLLLMNVPAVIRKANERWQRLIPTAVLLLYAAFGLIIVRKRSVSFPTVERLFILLGLAVMLMAAFLWLRDRVRWQMRSKRYAARMTGESFLSEYEGYQTTPFRQKFVAVVRARGVLEDTPEADRLVGGLAVSVERDAAQRRRRRRFKSFPNIGIISPKFRPSSELIDELTLLLEQFRAGGPAGPAREPAPAPPAPTLREARA